MGEQLKIVYRDYGIADRFPDNVIELNKHLKKWPSLHKALIEHEARHTNRKGFTKEDLLHDLSTPNQLSTWKMMKFIVRHPFSLVQFVPIYWTKKRGLIIDYNLIIIWCVICLITFLGLFFGNVL